MTIAANGMKKPETIADGWSAAIAGYKPLPGVPDEFIGADGKVLKKTGLNPATYRLKGNEKYVRATVTNSGGEKAWIQPAFVVH